MLQINNLSECIDKIIPMGISRSAIRFYGLPAWWSARYENDPYWAVEGATLIAKRFSLYLPSLLAPTSEKVQSTVPSCGNILFNLAAYTSKLLARAAVRCRNLPGITVYWIYFRPSESFILINREYPFYPTVYNQKIRFPEGQKYNKAYLNINWEYLEGDEIDFLVKVLGGGAYVSFCQG